MSQAAEIIERFVALMRYSEEQWRNFHPYGEALIDLAVKQAMGERGPSTLPAAPTRAAQVREIIYTAQDAAVRRLWQQHRTVYDLDPNLWAELGQITPDTVIPAGLMSQMPHSDPFIALPEPVLLPIDGTHRMRIQGFFVVGCTGGHDNALRGITSTHGDNANGDLMLLIGAEVESHDGRPYMIDDGHQDMVWSRATLDLSRGERTVEQLTAVIIERFDGLPLAGPGDFHLPIMVQTAVAALVYLCAKNAELEPLPDAIIRRQQAQRGSKLKKLNVVKVGYHIGAQLRAWRRSGSPAPDDGHGGGAPRRPHVRRAHLHTYRVGPGRRQTEVRFLSPIPVGFRGGEADKTTIIPVR
jgi:hypothetical protein